MRRQARVIDAMLIPWRVTGSAQGVRCVSPKKEPAVPSNPKGESLVIDGIRPVVNLCARAVAAVCRRVPTTGKVFGLR